MKNCEVCNKNAGVIVACAGSLPISLSYCQECLDRGAEAYWILRTEIVGCGGIEKLWDPEIVLLTPTYYCSEYCTLGEALSKDPCTIEQEIIALDKSYTKYMEAESKKLDGYKEENFNE